MSRSRFTLAALLGASTLIALLAGEAVLRLATGPYFPGGDSHWAPWMVFDPVYSWRLVAGSAVTSVAPEGGESVLEPAGEPRFTIDSLGLRGREIGVAKPPGRLRIVCMGDSGTFGMIQRIASGAKVFVPIQSYPELLTDRIAAGGVADVEVVNAGVVGYSTSHGLRQLVLQILDLEPDVVTLRFSVNDQYYSWNPALRAREPENALLRSLLYGLADWKLMRLGLWSWQRMPGVHPEAGSVPWVSDERFRRNLERFAELSREHGFHLAMVDYPVGPLTDAMIEAAESERFIRALHDGVAANVERLQAIAREVAAEQGIPFVETASRDPMFFSQDDFVHPTLWGAGAIADALHAELRRQRWLERR